MTRPERPWVSIRKLKNLGPFWPHIDVPLFYELLNAELELPVAIQVDHVWIQIRNEIYSRRETR